MKKMKLKLTQEEKEGIEFAKERMAAAGTPISEDHDWDATMTAIRREEEAEEKIKKALGIWREPIRMPVDPKTGKRGMILTLPYDL